ncbi:MAG: FAD binding domain-containing protein [Solidesulfovibrio sp.]|uniref:FAD binding domain-containing protein n=1 Tax=Solidesulfovibrio sp. TaxID=2910990 RepID=UPI002B1EE20F|nr:FAD binding domain-containing protein [Solidesulfovibrio sp.]MEA4856298.1 FAD binding domain-containing protein [Solidesulfovibrio sp.]
MATVRDSMPSFDLYQPADLDAALALAGRLGPAGWLLAGGCDSLERFKDRHKTPKAVIDLGGVAELAGIRADGDDLVIGPMTTLTDVARHPLVRERFGLLARAAGEVAAPQIRNQGTLGGNIAQDTRCWYYRAGWTCYRAGGNLCYADTPQGRNREHAILGASRCVAVSPSDTAPALVALEARLVIRSAAGRREVAAEDFFVGPDRDITRLTILKPGEVLGEIRLPPAWAGAPWAFEKVRDRPVWDFALVNMAAVLRTTGDRLDKARVVLGAVAARPWRLAAIEAAVAGRPRAEAAALAGRLAVAEARPLSHNGYKVTLAQNLVFRAIAGKEAA